MKLDGVIHAQSNHNHVRVHPFQLWHQLSPAVTSIDARASKYGPANLSLGLPAQCDSELAGETRFMSARTHTRDRRFTESDKSQRFAFSAAACDTVARPGSVRQPRRSFSQPVTLSN
jgi:hypothetical protein